MSPGTEGEAGDAAGLTYPSPGAEGMESGPFYHSARDGAPEQRVQAEQQDVDEVQTQEHDQAQILGQDDATSQHHASRPANLEELQLAAQLGQGLAGTSILPATDPNMTVEDPSMRNIMPHPDAEQHHTPSYVQEAPPTDPMAQHQMPVTAGPTLPPQYAMGEGIPPRKRSKVSRACDECRRKKIKCDAQSDSGETPCSSCARSSIRCLFSRVPQKRGPSKGYIKELADRIHSIENKLESEGNLSQDDIDKLFATDRSRHSSGPEDSTRKRPFSAVSLGDHAAPTTVRQAPWASQARSRSIQSASGRGEGPDQESGNSSLAPQPTPIKSDETPRTQRADSADVPMMDGEDATAVDEQAFQDFLTAVQPLYPVLPTDLARVQSLLSQANGPVRSAFSLALSGIGQPSSENTKIASSLLHEWESSDAPSSRATDIVHAQTLLMLVIDADWRGKSTLPFLLSRAIALANLMELWKSPLVDSTTEHDSHDQLCVRIWWSLVLMDRWHAAGTGQPTQIPDRSAIVPAYLENVIGEVPFHLLRLSKLLNRISFVIGTLQTGSYTAEAPMAAILTDYIENYREDLPAHIDAAAYPMIHLAYWHCRLLVTMLTPGATPKEIIWPTKELAHLLSVTPELKGPLSIHFVSLATMSLSKLAKTEATREDAVDMIKEIIDRHSGGHWDGVKDKLADGLRPTSSSAAGTAASQGLQHLADLATAHEGLAAGEEVPFGAALATGYLQVAS
ncbi:C6 finger domain-containing protein [Metarhizium album ARSEF 1941]|uniref:C6 finger domain-containing protein n=1 Tax=Metarhizium album (strain ARSEF 1941) TaxID=1081103 RepID=A0A0B2X7C9_METAS|nr:C6 finger domain-containing protein [Metarhizium album ARSEF 1941]KHO01668.1 C6 finger domain-containing protein [Metarhizium album ARSEF 1941]